MTDVVEVAGRRLLMVAPDDPVVRDTQAVLDLIAEGSARDARLIVVPVDRLDPSFFRLRSGFAGEVLQKLANYRFTLAVLGDVSVHTRGSAAFADLVREANRGREVCFYPDLATLSDRLAAGGGRPGPCLGA